MCSFAVDTEKAVYLEISLWMGVLLNYTSTRDRNLPRGEIGTRDVYSSTLE